MEPELEIDALSSPLPSVESPTAEVDRLGDEIAELSAHLEAATARLLALIRAFDARGGWLNGFRSCAAWLSWRCNLDPGAARERVRVARALGDLPRLAGALARGELSYAKIRALTRVATPETEECLLAVGRAGTAEHVERIVRGWRRLDRQVEAREAARQHMHRRLHVYQEDDGTVVVRGRLAPEAGVLLVRALDAARERLYQDRRAATRSRAGAVVRVVESGGDRPAAGSGPALAESDTEWASTAYSPSDQVLEPVDTPTMDQQQADALALLAETALYHGLDPGTPGERYQVVVHVDAAVLADPDQPGQSVLDDGACVSAEPSMWLSPLPVPLKRPMLRAWGGRGRARYWCEPSPTRNLTRGVARYPIVSTQRAL